MNQFPDSSLLLHPNSNILLHETTSLSLQRKWTMVIRITITTGQGQILSFSSWLMVVHTRTTSIRDLSSTTFLRHNIAQIYFHPTSIGTFTHKSISFLLFLQSGYAIVLAGHSTLLNGIIIITCNGREQIVLYNIHTHIHS